MARSALFTRSLKAATIVAAFGLPAAAPAQPAVDPSPLTTIGDPLDLARQVDTMGDDAVLALLTEGSLAERLGAIRASRWLSEPERALAALGALAAGDDPDLAPAAARAGDRIVERLDHDTLQAREADPGLLDPSPWTELAADESARADLRAIGERVARTLGTLSA